jgi:hypothetical protein
MLKWQSFDGTPVAWDDLLTQAAEPWIYQSWGWGEFKRSSGWIPERRIAKDAGGAVVAQAQVLVRRIPGLGAMVWVPGGPVPLNGEGADLGDMVLGLHESLEAPRRFCYLRCYLMQVHQAGAAYDLNRSLYRPSNRLGSGFSIQFDLDPDEGIWLKSMTGKHRYYVRKALAVKGLSWRFGQDDDLLVGLADLSARMQREKTLAVSCYSFDELKRLRDLLPNSARVLVGSFDGKPISACLALRTGTRAIYTSAATVGAGRDIGAAYAMLAVLRQNLRDEGVRMLDFGGIDPFSAAARGVDHFKGGFGGRTVEYLGEWEAGSRASRLIGNFLVGLRRNG